MPQPTQLALHLPHRESFALEDFVRSPANDRACALVLRWPDWPSPIMALIGPEGSGKSHLASIWAEQAGARQTAARHLGVRDVPAALSTGALVLEDADRAGCDDRALFHLFNLVREFGASLLLTARTAPSTWAVTVPDLASRLRSVPVAELPSPDDDLLEALIVKQCADRQIEADPALVGFLLSRMERSAAAVRDTTARLDLEGLRQRRPVNRALASELLRAPSA